MNAGLLALSGATAAPPFLTSSGRTLAANRYMSTVAGPKLGASIVAGSVVVSRPIPSGICRNGVVKSIRSSGSHLVNDVLAGIGDVPFSGPVFYRFGTSVPECDSNAHHPAPAFSRRCAVDDAHPLHLLGRFLPEMKMRSSDSRGSRSCDWRSVSWFGCTQHCATYIIIHSACRFFRPRSNEGFGTFFQRFVRLIRAASAKFPSVIIERLSDDVTSTP